MTTILKFWLCVLGTDCAPSDVHQWTIRGDVVICDEYDAWTNVKAIPGLLEHGLAPRHSCEPSGDDL